MLEKTMTLTEEDSAVLQDLLRRVESATGADRELDTLIAQAVAKPATLLNGQTFDEAIERFPNDLAGIARHWPVPEFTASLDAALALVERVLPGTRKAISHRNFQYDGWLVTLVPEVGNAQQGRSQSLPLALLAALLRALIAEQAAGQSLTGKSVDGSSPQTPESPQ